MKESAFFGGVPQAVQLRHTPGRQRATARSYRFRRTGRVLLSETGGAASTLLPKLVCALKSQQPDGDILPLLMAWKTASGISFGAAVRACHRSLDRERQDRLTKLLGLLATNTRGTAELLIKTQLQTHVNEQFQVITVAPNLAIDAYLNGTLYPGGAAGTLGSVLATCKINAAICGFLPTGPSGALFTSLAHRKGIDTRWLTPVNGECGFNFFPSPTEKLSRCGTRVSREERTRLVDTVLALVGAADPDEPPLVILSGTIPGLDEEDCTLYQDLINAICQLQLSWPRRSKIWVDARGQCLLKAVLARPDYVKINLPEFINLLERLDSLELVPEALRAYSADLQSIACVAKALIERFDIPSMTISMARDGALQVWHGSHFALHVRSICKSPGFVAGLGDTLLAFQAVGEVTATEYARHLEFGVAAALVSSRKAGTSLAENVQEVVPFLRHVRRKIIAVGDSAPRPWTVERFIRGLLAKKADLVVMADMDGTLTSARHVAQDDVLNAILALLRSGVAFAVLTASGIGAVTRQVLAGLRSKADQIDLANLYILTGQGGQVYHFNAVSGLLNQCFAVDLTNQSFGGPAKYQLLREVLVQVALKFKLPGDAGKFIEDRGSQITFLPLGCNASDVQKDEYDRSGGRKQRLEMARFMNHKFRQLRLDVRARIAGSSSIDIALKNIDKGFGVQKLAELLGVEPSTILFIGNDFSEDGSDYPAVGKAGLAINVGPSVLHQRQQNIPLIESRKLGPPGTLEILTRLLILSETYRLSGKLNQISLYRTL